MRQRASRQIARSIRYPQPGAFADEMLRQNYERLKPTVIGAVCRRFDHNFIVAADLEACYQDAWVVLHKKLAFEKVENMRGFLIKVASNRAIDAMRRAHLYQQTQGDIGTLKIHSQYNIVHDIETKRRIRYFSEALKRLLPGKECEVAALCLFGQYRRRDAASVLGISERRLRTLMNRAYPTLSPAMTLIEKGEWCDEYASTIRALRRNLLNPDDRRYRDLMRHLKQCPTCSAAARNSV
jgi:RNA polymerase sigma factor (sigma-70 family)